MEKLHLPDFIQIPCQIAFNKKLQPADKNVYGIIYFFWQMEKGCILANSSFQELTGIKDPQTIQNCLLRLERNGFIQRKYRDPERKIREEIIPLITYKAVGIDGVPLNNGTVKQGDGVPLNNGYNNNNIIRTNIAPTALKQPELIQSGHKEIIKYFFDSVKKGRRKLKFNEDVIRECRIKHRSGEKIPDLAKQYNTSCVYMWGIINRKVWRHVD